jgi:hypothetical protein
VSDFPRRYRLKTGYLAAVGALFALMLLGPGAWSMARVVIFVGLAAMGGAMVHARIVLTPDTIDVKTPLGWRRVVRREMIRGWRAVPQDNEHLLVLELREGKPLEIPPTFAVDQTFDDWVASLPDLERQASRPRPLHHANPPADGRGVGVVFHVAQMKSATDDVAAISGYLGAVTELLQEVASQTEGTLHCRFDLAPDATANLTIEGEPPAGLRERLLAITPPPLKGPFAVAFAVRKRDPA